MLFLVPYIMMSSFSEQFSLCFISQHVLFPVVLHITTVLLGKFRWAAMIFLWAPETWACVSHAFLISPRYLAPLGLTNYKNYASPLNRKSFSFLNYVFLFGPNKQFFFKALKWLCKHRITDRNRCLLFKYKTLQNCPLSWNAADHGCANTELQTMFRNT